jgi:ChaB protein
LRTSRRYGWPAADELPGTLQRSCQEAQATFLEAREEAIRVLGEGDDAYRAAYAVLKQRFEKCGDHWIAKAGPAG